MATGQGTARTSFKPVTSFKPQIQTKNIWASPKDKVNKMTPAITADEPVKQLKGAWRNIQQCAGKLGDGNAVSDA